MKNNNVFLRDKVRGAFLGVAIGDAMGMPVETMTAEEIGRLPGGGVDRYLPALQRNPKSIRRFEAGQTTDDWQLTAAIARSLISCSGYDFQDTVAEQVRELKISTAGWGKSTKRSLIEIKKFVDSNGMMGRNPVLPVDFSVTNHSDGGGCGNGVAMKIAPIGLMTALRPWVTGGSLLDLVVEQGQVTHADLRASIAAYAMAWLVCSLVREKIESTERRKLFMKWHRLFRAVHAAEVMFRGSFFQDAEMFSARLDTVKYEFASDCSLGMLVQCIGGTSCYCLESVPFAISVFFRHPTDFRAGIFEAVNAGGDTDSNASMAGALIGANVGMTAIPEDMLHLPFEADPVIALADKFFDALT